MAAYDPVPPHPADESLAPSASPDDQSSRDASSSPALLAEKNANHETDLPILPASSSVVSEKNAKRRGPMIALCAAITLAVIVVVVAVAVTQVLKHKKADSSGDGLSSSGSSSSSHGKSGALAVVTGGDGSDVQLADGSKITYKNPYGGYWYYDPENPFTDNAQPNSWTPPLNTTWDFTKDSVKGVNLGGWFVIEPFISPALFQKYPDATDEWSLSIAMAKDDVGGGLNQLETHYDTFITEEDIAKIAGAGLNWVRIPIPYWAIESWSGEPFLAKVSWKYIVRALEWCRKYGIRVNLDLHTVPGSQSGYNHSGKEGQVNFMHGPMGLANAQRALYYMRVITEFISQPEYVNVVPMFGILNEPFLHTIGKDQLFSFYFEAHRMIRSITGFGAGKGPYISLHDGFTAVDDWTDFLPGSDRMVLDHHPYFSFSGSPALEPIGADGTGGIWPQKACETFGPAMNSSRKNFGVSVGGEFSGGYNDCGLFLRSAHNTPPTTYGGDCNFWQDARQWNDTTKAGVKQFVMASMDALGDWFFWTWKIDNSSVSGVPSSPLWSYSEGLDSGYIPTDPRQAVGVCASLGVPGTPFDGTYKPYQTGGAGAGTISASASAAYGTWPVASILDGGGAPVATYTPTGTIVTLAGPTFTGAAATKTVSGWANSQDTAGAPTPVAGCTYPNAWDSTAGGTFNCNNGNGGANVARAIKERAERHARKNRATW